MEHDISQIRAFTIFLDAGADLQTSNKEGERLLHVTAKRWWKTKYVERDQRHVILGIFKELVARGLDPRVEDAKFRTAINVAVASGNLFIVALFGQRGEGMVVENVVSVDAESVGEGSEEDMSWDEV